MKCNTEASKPEINCFFGIFSNGAINYNYNYNYCIIFSFLARNGFDKMISRVM